VEDLLGPARPPRMPMNLMERHHRTVGGVERGVEGQKELIDWFLFDWIDGNSIGHNPLIYMEGWSYPSRKPLQDLFSKFPTSLEE
jgi:hypothetical protein